MWHIHKFLFWLIFLLIQLTTKDLTDFKFVSLTVFFMLQKKCHLSISEQRIYDFSTAHLSTEELYLLRYLRHVSRDVSYHQSQTSEDM